MNTFLSAVGTFLRGKLNNLVIWVVCTVLLAFLPIFIAYAHRDVRNELPGWIQLFAKGDGLLIAAALAVDAFGRGCLIMAKGRSASGLLVLMAGFVILLMTLVYYEEVSKLSDASQARSEPVPDVRALESAVADYNEAERIHSSLDPAIKRIQAAVGAESSDTAETTGTEIDSAVNDYNEAKRANAPLAPAIDRLRKILQERTVHRDSDKTLQLSIQLFGWAALASLAALFCEE